MHVASICHQVNCEVLCALILDSLHVIHEVIIQFAIRLIWCVSQGLRLLGLLGRNSGSVSPSTLDGLLVACQCSTHLLLCCRVRVGVQLRRLLRGGAGRDLSWLKRAELILWRLGSDFIDHIIVKIEINKMVSQNISDVRCT